MTAGREPGHVRADLRDHDLSGPPLDPWDAQQDRHRGLRRLQRRDDPLVDLADRFVEMVDVREDLRDQEPVMLAELRVQRLA